MLEVTLNQDEYSRWAWLDEAAELAYRTKQYEKAKGYALESLSLSGRHKDDWNHGNSIHNANMVLGRLRLRKGDVEKAKDYLLRSAESQGSPQLDTFGPSLELANQLLLAGKRDAVLRYLESISSFWEMDNGCIEEWIAQIENNQTPELCNCKCR